LQKGEAEMSKLWKISPVIKVINVTCCNCGGNHEATSFDFPTRVKENEVAKVRAIQSISYAAAVKRVAGWNGAHEESMVVDMPSLQAAGVAFHQQDPAISKVKKVEFVTFIAMVINSIAKVESKSRKKEIIVEEEERFLELKNFSVKE
jgi:hypothetical protein